VFFMTILLTLLTITHSKRLSDFLDTLSDHRVGVWGKLRAFIAVWRKPRSLD